VVTYEVLQVLFVVLQGSIAEEILEASIRPQLVDVDTDYDICESKDPEAEEVDVEDNDETEEKEFP
jgi:hypothetical protein